MFYQRLKNIYHLFQAVGANLVFEFPSKKIKIIGVTGTNGKTTTIWMINQILEEAGFKTAVCSTINFKIGDKNTVNRTKFTTLSSWRVQKFIKNAVEAQCEYLVLETSSHALDQNRVWGVDYDVAVITNIAREHLDYHKTMEEYKNVKKKLFDIIQKSKFKSQNHNSKLKNCSLVKDIKDDKNRQSPIANRKSIVVNLEMEWAEEFLEVEADKAYGYKIQKSKVKSQNHNSKLKIINADNIRLNSTGSTFEISAKSRPSSGWQKFELSLPGEFNIENALAAICVGLSQDVKLETAARALKKIKKVPGRMDYVENEKGLKIIIDYAVTPDSMEKLGQLVSTIKKEGKIIWVFGACGERDRGKRPMMGAIGAKYANVVIITNEDPYGEKEENIIDEVLSGIIDKSQISNLKFQNHNLKFKTGNTDAEVFKIIDREEAIKKALEMAQRGDIILITGKGTEETMAVGKKRIPWNDRVVVEKTLKAKN